MTPALAVSAVSAVAPAAVSSPVATPTPFPDYTGDPNLITPGVIGFFAILFIAVATIFLLLDMNRRIRRARYREEARRKLDEEERQ